MVGEVLACHTLRYFVLKGDVWVWGPGSDQDHTSSAYPHGECRGQLRKSHGYPHGAWITLLGWRKVKDKDGVVGVYHVGIP